MAYVKKRSDDDFDYYHREETLSSYDPKFINFQQKLNYRKFLSVKTATSEFFIYIRSFQKICSMVESEPEEHIIFAYYDPKVYSKHDFMKSNYQPSLEEIIKPEDEENKPTDILLNSVNNSMSHPLLSNSNKKEDRINVNCYQWIYLLLVVFSVFDEVYFGLSFIFPKIPELLKWLSLGDFLIQVTTGIIGYFVCHNMNYKKSLVISLILLTLICFGGVGVFIVVNGVKDSYLIGKIVMFVILGINILLLLIIFIIDLKLLDFGMRNGNAKDKIDSLNIKSYKDEEVLDN